MRKPPKPLGISLSKALEIAAPILKGQGKASEHSLPKFHDNVFARMLAARPKMDAITRRVYPSTILAKVGKAEDGAIGPVNPLRPLFGTRMWMSYSPSVEGMPAEVRGRLASKQSSKLRVVENFNVKDALLEQLKWSLEMYMKYLPPSDRPAACYVMTTTTTTTSNQEKNIPVIDQYLVGKVAGLSSNNDIIFDVAGIPELQDIGIPAVIHNGKFGMFLAGFLYKYLYIHQSTHADKNLGQ